MSDEENLCAVCGQTLYPGCKNAVGGGGNIITTTGSEGEQLVKLCPNIKKLSIKQYLTNIEPRMGRPEIIHNRNSPLFQPGEIDLTSENMFFRSTDWNVFLSNLKWVAAYKFKRNLFIRVVTDLHLVQTFVGNTAMKARLKSQHDDETVPIYNGLPDLLEAPDLVIIKLGVLTHSNKAASNVLSEALLIRNSVAKPTWVVEPANKKFEPYQRTDFGTSYGMPSCNEDVLEYLEENFDQLTLEEVEGIEEETQPAVEMTAEIPEEMDAEMGEAVEGIPDEEEEEPSRDVSDDDMSDLLGEDFDKPDWMKKKKKSTGKGRFGR